MLKADVDIAKLTRSLKAASKAFGETGAQAIVRWGVQCGRELATQTQAWGRTRYGKTKGTGATTWAKGAQEGAMLADAYNVISIVPTVGPRNKKGLRDSAAVNDWIELNRTRRRSRTAKIPISERKVCTEKVFKKAMKERFKRAGMAKGGWLGAGMAMAKHQRGAGRITIGKNYMSFAQKHSRFGSARAPMNSFSPVGHLTNSVKHVASSHVLSPTAIREASGWSLKATIKWYNKAISYNLNKLKP